MSNKSMLSKVNKYITYRRKLGNVFSTQSVLLTSFGRYVDLHAVGQPLTLKLALHWATLSESSKNQRISRLNVLRPFAEYLSITDRRTELIPTRILGVRYDRTVPYIYSQKEIRELMETRVCQYRSRELTNLAVSTMIGLMACTGLRIGEVITLQRENIDWNQSTMIVRWSKRMPMRLIPIDSSTIDALKAYEQSRDACFPEKTDQFFINSFGRTFSWATMRDYWHIIIQKTGIEQKSRKRPRMHDLRHTFACNHLLRAYQNKMNIDEAVHLLSVYLGHASPKETYWYLSAIPELLNLCGKHFEEHVESCRKNANNEPKE